jgi:hypothetical protein
MWQLGRNHFELKGFSLKRTVLLLMRKLLEILSGKVRRNPIRGAIAIVLLSLVACLSLFGQESLSDPEGYKLKLQGQFWYADPTATIKGSSAQAPISFDKTFGFDNYSTFVANIDWHFARKHHLFLGISPNQTTRTAVLQQNITFRDKTFLAGSSATGELRNYAFAPGYRYDIIHRPRGHLGILIEINLLDIKASITGTVLQPGQATVGTASGSIFVPLPVGGPDVRYYFLKNRLFVDGNVKGMYFFGYGNFVSSAGKVGFNFGPHVSAVGGYQLGSHLAIHGTSSRLDVRQTQRGPTAGLEFNF